MTSHPVPLLPCIFKKKKKGKDKTNHTGHTRAADRTVRQEYKYILFLAGQMSGLTADYKTRKDDSRWEAEEKVTPLKEKRPSVGARTVMVLKLRGPKKEQPPRRESYSHCAWPRMEVPHAPTGWAG